MVIKVAKKVETQSNIYNNQLKIVKIVLIKKEFLEYFDAYFE